MISFDDKGGGYFEQIRLRGFNFEAQKEKKLVYTTFGFFDSPTKEEKKQRVLSNASHITLRKVSGARFFESRKIYENRNINFLKGMRFVAERECFLTLDNTFDERFVDEFQLKVVTRRISRYDFIMPKYRFPYKGVEFNHFLFYVKMCQGNIKMKSYHQVTRSDTMCKASTSRKICFF